MAYLLDKDGYQLLDSNSFILVDSEHLYLITDRTAEDVQRVKELASKGLRMSEEEMAGWLSGLKGAYNFIDLNRVEDAVEYVASRLQTVGWFVYPVTKKDWTVSSFPTSEEMQRYLDNIRLLRSTLPVGIPEVPSDTNNLTYVEANTIEQILLLLDAAVTNILKNSIYSNETYSGEV